MYIVFNSNVYRQNFRYCRDFNLQPPTSAQHPEKDNAFVRILGIKQDGAPLHYTDNYIPSRCIDLRGPTESPTFCHI